MAEPRRLQRHAEASFSRFVPQHASEEEYRHFLQNHTDVRDRATRDKIYIRRRFVRAYPNLEDWFEEPLEKRLGRIYSRGADGRVKRFNDRIVDEACYWARPYLFFLAVRGYVRFDWEWLVATRRLNLGNYRRYMGWESQVEQLSEEARQLGIDKWATTRALNWTLSRIFLHTGNFDAANISEDVLNSLGEALLSFEARPDLELFYDSRASFTITRKHYQAHLYRVKMILYQRGQLDSMPRKVGAKQAPGPSARPYMEALAERYLQAIRPTVQPATLATKRNGLREFIDWIARAHPEVDSFAQVDRNIVIEYAGALEEFVSTRTGQSLAPATRQHKLGAIAGLFRDTADWGWEDVPGRPLLAPRDFPKRTVRVPRYIPEKELAPVMEAIRSLECTYQRTALLVARYSGARRDEIRRLEFDCLDSYPNGLPRLRIPAGKTFEERMVPLNEEAASAIRELQRISRPGRGEVDPITGKITRYLFTNRGKLFAAVYLFDKSLQRVSEEAGLIPTEGGAGTTAHRFRHTLGTELAESGAKLHTIMSVLGHKSPGMSVVYARISDETVRKDYEAVLGPGAVIAGPSAEVLRTGQLPDADVDWLKTNFFKTELELGHCLRLPQEGPCECEMYLTCAKFVTSSEYVPRLRARRDREFELIEDAACRGWEREVERHQRTVVRIEQLLTELGEQPGQ